METHVKVLGVLFMVFGTLGLLAAILLLAFFGGLAGIAGARSADPVAVPVLGGLGLFLFIVIAVVSLPGVITGWGLLNYREWARILGIILSVLNLPGFPFGTVLGVYGLWVLLNQQTAPLFRGVQAVPPPIPPARS